MENIAKFLGTPVWGGIGVILTPVASVLGYLLSKLRKENAKLKDLYKYYDLFVEFGKHQNKCSTQLKRISTILSLSEELDDKLCYLIKVALYELSEKYALFLDDNESRLIDEIKRMLHKKNIKTKILSDKLLLLSVKILCERKYLK